MNNPYALPTGPVTREHLDTHAAAMTARLRAAGRAVGEAVRGADTPPPLLTPAEEDERTLVSLQLDSELRAALIVMLDEKGRLAVCDRDDLVAEAQLVLAEH